MANKRHKPEEIVTKLRQVEVLVGQGMARIDAIRWSTSYDKETEDQFSGGGPVGSTTEPKTHTNHSGDGRRRW